ncbi:hypothetical protein LB504_002425 [Fusarium proliferatum]|nr:hypothetical protein LB504_002425 [Fusarium proliferatum]
MRLGWHIRPAR